MDKKNNVKILFAAALAFTLIIAAGCKDLENVKVTYKVYTTYSTPSAIPTVTVVYTDKDGKNYQALVDLSQSPFEYSMVIKMGSQIELTANAALPAANPQINLIAEIWINDAADYSTSDDGSDSVLSCGLSEQAKRD